MKRTFLMIFALFLVGCAGPAVEEVIDEPTSVTEFETIAEYIDEIHKNWPGENPYFYEYGTSDYSLEGFELITDSDGQARDFENDQTLQYDNAFFWVYAETGYELAEDGYADFYLRGLEMPRDAVYGPFTGKLGMMLSN